MWNTTLSIFVQIDPLQPWEYVVVGFAGILTGMINTIAGSGTIVSFAALLWVGVPINLANTTNRLGVLFQNLAAVGSYRVYGKASLVSVGYSELFSSLIGACLGAWLASFISASSLSYFVLAVLFVLTYLTARDLGKGVDRKLSLLRNLNPTAKGIVFFLVGVYGGFIQIGVGIMFLVMIRSVSDFTWNQSNYAKLVIILLYTVPTTLFFIYRDMIVWVPGIMLAVGQIVGAWMTGRLFNKNERIKDKIPYFILIMLIITIIRVILDIGYQV